jgi:hypothetical protein
MRTWPLSIKAAHGTTALLNLRAAVLPEKAGGVAN